MSLQTLKINSVRITFDEERTKKYRTSYNRPCECQNCRNYYKNVENNFELVEFLRGFGIDYTCTEEVFSWDLGNDSDSFIHHEGYYGVFGKIDAEEFDFEKFGVKITFQKAASVPCDRTGDYFWICVEGDFPYLLNEERDMPVPFSRKVKHSKFFHRIKTIFKK